MMRSCATRAVYLGALLLGVPMAVTAQQASAVSASADSSYRAPGSTRGAGPNGATLRCGDGTYPAPGATDAACEGKGGVRLRFPLLKTPAPPRAPGARSARPTAPAAAAISEPAPPPPTESRANVFIPAERPSADVSLICKDGTQIRADTAAARCAPHGGLKARMPRKPKS